MIRTAKIQLSPHEMELVTNSEWILTKHIITKKVFEMFGELSKDFSKEIEPYNYLFPENVKYQNGKITKGENYRLLPYVILDHPSFFWKDRIFAVRSMFWWGNFFSITLHLSGEHKQKFITDETALLSFLQKNNFFICVNEDEWQHHFENDNYKPAAKITLEEFKGINQKNFFKAAKNLLIQEWNYADEFFIESFRKIMEMLQISYRGDKIDL